jgi:CAAX prenyl protease-like protein
MIGSDSHERAYLAPFFVFLGFLLVGEVIARLGDGYVHWMLAQPRYWIFPVQTFVCAWLLWHWRGQYAFGPFRGCLLAAGVGVVVLGIWVSPQWLFGAAPRTEGFQPAYFGTGGAPYYANLVLRLVRMIIVVPLVEEIFWRGWLLRYLVHEDFRQVPFGTFAWKSFLITSAAFCVEHQPADWAAAAITGALYNLVACRTKSLAACVVAHAVTNAGLAIYILQTKQWGFW